MTDLGNIPQIGSDQIGLNSPKKPATVKPDVAMFDNAPNDVSLGSFFGKIFIGVCVGICVSALLFGALTIGGISNPNDASLNPLLWILFPIIGFVACFIGNLALAGLLNIFFSKRYYNFSKMFGLIFASSLITLPLFIIISAIYYFINKSVSIEVNYLILKFQIIFSLFLSLNLIDFLSQPNYSASSLMGNSLGCALAIVAALVVSGNPIISAIITYAAVLIGAGIRDAIYYKFYERGSNPFYLPSLNELREERKKEEIKKKKDEEEINVEMK